MFWGVLKVFRGMFFDFSLKGRVYRIDIFNKKVKEKESEARKGEIACRF